MIESLILDFSEEYFDQRTEQGPGAQGVPRLVRHSPDTNPHAGAGWVCFEICADDFQFFAADLLPDAFDTLRLDIMKSDESGFELRID